MRRADYAAACEQAALDPTLAAALLNALAEQLHRYNAQTRTETLALDEVFENAIVCADAAPG